VVDDGAAPPVGATRLGVFAGDWTVAGSIADGSGSVAVTGTWRFTMAADGWGVSGSMETAIERMERSQRAS